MATFDQLKHLFTDGLEQVIIVASILVLTALFAHIASFLLKRKFKKSSEQLNTDPKSYSFVRHTMTAIIYLVGIGFSIYTIPSLRSLSVSMFAGAGVLAVIIGFASQQAFANVVAGIFIIIFKPFRVGERVKLDEKYFGTVEDITLRHTVIRNWENKRIIIPNTVMSNQTIENWDITDKKICKWLEFGISYDSDVDKAIRIIQEEAKKHPNVLDNRTAEEKKDKIPIVIVRVLSYGDFTVNLRAYIWAEDPMKAFVMGCDLNKSIKERWDKEGIEIPFPYRTIVYKKDIEAIEKKRRSKRNKKNKK